MHSIKKNATSVALATVVVLNVAGSAFAESQTTSFVNAKVDRSAHKRPVSKKLAAQLQAALDKAVQEAGITGGATVAIISPQGTWFGASGVSNLETQESIQPDNILGMGSTNKPFTAATVLKVAEQGKLSLDDTLGKWLPDIAAKIPDGNRITIRQLLNGTSGIPDFTEDEKYLADTSSEPYKKRTPKELVAYIYGKPRFQGEQCLPKWCYPNTGMVLAGMIVEKATGSSLASVMRREIFKPLGLKQTVFGPDEKIVGRLARGYQDFLKADGSFGQDGIPEDVTDIGPLVFGFTASVYSSAPDTARFFEALLSGKLLQPDSLKQMLSLVVTGNEGMQYGLGTWVEETPWGKAFAYPGTDLGYKAIAYYLPNRNITIVALGNHSYELENPAKERYIRTIAANSLNTFLEQGQGGDRKPQVQWRRW